MNAKDKRRRKRLAKRAVSRTAIARPSTAHTCSRCGDPYTIAEYLALLKAGTPLIQDALIFCPKCHFIGWSEMCDAEEADDADPS